MRGEAKHKKKAQQIKTKNLIKTIINCILWGRMRRQLSAAAASCIAICSRKPVVLVGRVAKTKRLNCLVLNVLLHVKHMSSFNALVERNHFPFKILWWYKKCMKRNGDPVQFKYSPFLYVNSFTLLILYLACRNLKLAMSNAEA